MIAYALPNEIGPQTQNFLKSEWTFQIRVGGGGSIFQNQKFLDLLSQIFVDIQANMGKKGLSQHYGRNSHNKLQKSTQWKATPTCR